MNVLQNLIDILKNICDKVYQQGSAPEKYKPEFFTYWQNAADNHKYYNNKAMGCDWSVDVNFYSTDREAVFEKLEQARIALTAAGWRVNGKGHDVASGDSAYTGRGFTAQYFEK